MSTLLLTRSLCARLLGAGLLAEPLRRAFASYSSGSKGRARRVVERISADGTSTVLFPGSTGGVPAYTVKVHAKFPGQDPAIRGVLCLHDVKTGALLSIMDSTYLTAVRTGMAGALAADLLANPSASRVSVIGAGVQGEHQLRSLAQLRAVRRVDVYDTIPERAATYARDMGEELGIPVKPRTSLEEAVSDGEIVMIATWSHEPMVFPEMLRAGAHITSVV